MVARGVLVRKVVEHRAPLGAGLADLGERLPVRFVVEDVLPLEVLHKDVIGNRVDDAPQQIVLGGQRSLGPAAGGDVAQDQDARPDERAESENPAEGDRARRRLAHEFRELRAFLEQRLLFAIEVHEEVLDIPHRVLALTFGKKVHAFLPFLRSSRFDLGALEGKAPLNQRQQPDQLLRLVRRIGGVGLERVVVFDDPLLRRGVAPEQVLVPGDQEAAAPRLHFHEIAQHPFRGFHDLPRLGHPLRVPDEGPGRPQADEGDDPQHRQHQPETEHDLAPDGKAGAGTLGRRHREKTGVGRREHTGNREKSKSGIRWNLHVQEICQPSHVFAPSPPDAHRWPAHQRGGGGGIRTHGTLRLSGFQDRRNRPLCHPSSSLLRGTRAVFNPEHAGRALRSASARFHYGLGGVNGKPFDCRRRYKSG